jgi:hypothetical protein
MSNNHNKCHTKLQGLEPWFTNDVYEFIYLYCYSKACIQIDICKYDTVSKERQECYPISTHTKGTQNIITQNSTYKMTNECTLILYLVSMVLMK